MEITNNTDQLQVGKAEFTPTEGNQEFNQSVGRTFTQDDVNRIVGERLAKERAKTDLEFSQREQELSKRELNLKAREIMSERKLPNELLEAVNYSDEKTLIKSLDIIEKYLEKPRATSGFKGVKPAESRHGIPNMEINSEQIRGAMGL